MSRPVALIRPGQMRKFGRQCIVKCECMYILHALSKMCGFQRGKRIINTSLNQEGDE